MLVVHKYDLGNFSEKMSKSETHKLPKFLEIEIETNRVIKYLKIYVINSHLFLWALVDLDLQKEKHSFKVIPTGVVLEKEFPKVFSFSHIDTFIETQWNHVWNLFEVWY